MYGIRKIIKLASCNHNKKEPLNRNIIEQYCCFFLAEMIDIKFQSSDVVIQYIL